MSFEAPLQLAWIALIVPVVLMYLRYVGRKTEDASTLAIWQHALTQRTLWSRWRRIVSIAAACVPVVLVALALAQPEFTAAKAAPRTLVVIIDNTASMNATDVRPSRLAQAKREAQRLIGRLRTDETMAILSADSFTHAHCGLTDDRRVLQAALGQVQPTEGAGNLSLAMATAQQLLAGQANPVLVVLSDRPIALDDKVAANKNIVVHSFGGLATNMAITKLALRPTPGDGTMHEVLVEVSNFSDAASDVSVELGLAGGASQTVAMNVLAGQHAQRVLPLRVEQAGLLTAKIAAKDDLAADNAAAVVVAPSNRLRVSLTAYDSVEPLRAALASIPGVEVVKSGAEADVAVINGPLPPLLPKVPTIFIGPRNDTDLWQVIGAEELESPQAATQIDHPLVAGVDLRRVAIERAVKLKLSNDAQVIAATAAGDPLLAIVPREVGDVVVLAFWPAVSDFALRGDFPRFLANALALLSRSASGDGASWATTDLFVEADQATDAQLVSPFGDATTASAGQPLAAALVHGGVWKLETSAGAAALPVNLNSNSESDLRDATAAYLPSRVPAPLLPDIGPLWRWLAGLAVVWVLGHWVFYQRRDID